MDRRETEICTCKIEQKKERLETKTLCSITRRRHNEKEKKRENESRNTVSPQNAIKFPILNDDQWKCRFTAPNTGRFASY